MAKFLGGAAALCAVLFAVLLLAFYAGAVVGTFVRGFAWMAQ